MSLFINSDFIQKVNFF
jgi:CRP-like cAMP-binding protein